MEFRRFNLDSINTLRPYFADNQYRLCDYTLGGVFIWRDHHETEYAIENGELYLKVGSPEIVFIPPQSSEPNRSSLEQIISYCAARGIPARLGAVPEPLVQGILELFPGSKAATDRDWSDYLYLSGDIASLAGRKYSGQRNHINRFMRDYLTWSFERITENNAPEVKEFVIKHAEEHIKDSPAYIEGNIKTLEVLDNLDAYGLFGGALYVDGAVIGASFGETVGDTMFVHTEKADTAYHGSYPMLVNQFAGMFVSGGAKYINREEDDGIEGLRTSKLSYHPIALLQKYVVELKY